MYVYLSPCISLHAFNPAFNINASAGWNKFFTRVAAKILDRANTLRTLRLLRALRKAPQASLDNSSVASDPNHDDRDHTLLKRKREDLHVKANVVVPKLLRLVKKRPASHTLSGFCRSTAGKFMVQLLIFYLPWADPTPFSSAVSASQVLKLRGVNGVLVQLIRSHLTKVLTHDAAAQLLGPDDKFLQKVPSVRFFLVSFRILFSQAKIITLRFIWS